MNEFYAFQEVEQLTENLRMWQQSGDFNNRGACVLLVACYPCLIRRPLIRGLLIRGR